MGKKDGTKDEVWGASQGRDGDFAGDGDQQSGRLGEEAEDELKRDVLYVPLLSSTRRRSLCITRATITGRD